METKANKFWDSMELDYDPYIRMTSELFRMSYDEVTGKPRFEVKQNLFFLNVYDPDDLKVASDRLWEYYKTHILPCNTLDGFSEKNEFVEHFLFMTEEVENLYPGWYDYILEGENDS